MCSPALSLGLTVCLTCHVYPYITLALADNTTSMVGLKPVFTLSSFFIECFSDYLNWVYNLLPVMIMTLIKVKERLEDNCFSF